jgi:hypothetical protein
MLLIPTLAILAVQSDRPIVVDADRLSKGGEVMVCKTRAKTNTRFGSRTCHTRAEWSQIAEQNRREAEDMVGGMRQNPCASEGFGGGSAGACDPVRGQ